MGDGVDSGGAAIKVDWHYVLHHRICESVKGQLQALTARQRSIILEAIENQLVHEPLVEARNRKLRRPIH